MYLHRCIYTDVCIQMHIHVSLYDNVRMVGVTNLSRGKENCWVLSKQWVEVAMISAVREEWGFRD